MQISFARTRREPVNLKAHASVCEPGMKIFVVLGLSWVSCPKEIAQFLGSVGDCLPELQNLWDEQQRWVRLRSFLEEDCLTALLNFGAQ